MKTLDRLGNRLCDYGLAVADEDFKIAKGFWARQDVVRWEGSFPIAGRSWLDKSSDSKVTIDSYDTAGKCAKYGFWLTEGGAAYGQYEAIAKIPGMNIPKDIITEEEFKRRHKVQ